MSDEIIINDQPVDTVIVEDLLPERYEFTDPLFYNGKSTYELYLMHTTDNPVLSIQEWLAKIKRADNEFFVDATEKALIATINDKINRSETLTATEIQLLVSNLVDSSPEALNTLRELAAALGNDPNFATTITNLIASKVTAVPGYSLTKNDLTDLLKAAYDEAVLAIPTKADKLISYVEKTESFTLTNADSDKWLNCNHATTPIVITVPTGLTDGKQFFIFQKGLAQVSILAGAGMMALATKLNLNAQYSACQISIEATEFKVIGEMKA